MEINISSLNKSFDGKHVLKDINFSVQTGEFAALLGPSGCGKTTLLNILAGFLTPESGTVTVGNDTWASATYSLAPEKRKVGMVFQDFALWPHMNVYENVAFGLKLRKSTKVEIQRRVQEVLGIVQMSDYQTAFPHQLSGGQKQRIAIARALAPSPSVMLMDEPLSSLDAKLREQMRWDLLDIVRRAGTTTIYVTHDQSEALSMADTIVLLNQGRTEQIGTPKELYECPRTVFTASFMGASNLLEGKTELSDDSTITLNCHGHMVRAAGSGTVGEAKIVSIRPTDLTMEANQTSHNLEEGAFSNTHFQGKVVQRAFHGSNWRYKVELMGSPVLTLEIWDQKEWNEGDEVHLTVPVNRCLVLEEKPSADTIVPVEQA
ncbi:ABC transporter ATP-binding protein [Alicyclobacillus sp. SO9]|uniref:ABC transporter ATP-binding protein n=1 Tax=Alicyclobacillus sp. SO9 TaxID=2665646 RepID=UPI0018E7713B|nr:ABC transporter ATP-binding protein [Alicyclobacillus sp. SO9]QQE78996.1 ABC transporter ATP-binding protein [Alicyclobacillus sp. SO9]